MNIFRRIVVLFIITLTISVLYSVSFSEEAIILEDTYSEIIDDILVDIDDLVPSIDLIDPSLENNYEMNITSKDESDEITSNENDVFDIQDGKLIKYSGSASSVIIPDGVKVIGTEAFKSCWTLQEVTFPNSISTIEQNAFYDCVNLNNISIPNSVSFIGWSAFQCCYNLKDVTINSKNIDIAAGVFTYCNRFYYYGSYYYSSPYFHIICNSNAIAWAKDNSFNYETIGHTIAIDPAIAPTYTSVGITEGAHCSVCGEIITEQQEIPAKELPENGLLLLNNTRSEVNLGDNPIQIVVNEDNAISYTSDAPKIAKVSKQGLVTPLREGDVNITVTLNTGTKLILSLIIFDPATISDNNIVLSIGKSFKLRVDGLIGRKITWSSSNNQIATVRNGTVKGIKAGKCTITATLSNGKSLICKVTVNDLAKLSISSLTLNVGKKGKITISNLANRKVTWTTSNKKIATVSKGIVTAVKSGRCFITAKIKNGKNLKCSITVNDPAKLSDKKLSLRVGETYELQIKGLANRSVSWSSSNKKIATVKNGKINALYMGKCTISAKIKNGKTLNCTVTVTDPAELSTSNLTLSTIDTVRIEIGDILKRNVSWSSTNSDVVEIVESEKDYAIIKGLKPGTAIIKASVNNGKDLKCYVQVTDPLIIRINDLYQLLHRNYKFLKLDFTNNSNKKVSYVEFEVLQYNNRGDKLDIIYGPYYLNETIKPHGVRSETYKVVEDTKRVKIVITEVTFSDKTTWKP